MIIIFCYFVQISKLNLVEKMASSKGYGMESFWCANGDFDRFVIRDHTGLINMFNDTIKGSFSCKVDYESDTWEQAYKFMKKNKVKYAPLLSHTFFGLYKLFCVGLRRADDAELKAHMEDFMAKATTLE